MTKIKAGASEQQEELAMKMMAKDATRSINRDDTHFGLGNRCSGVRIIIPRED